MEETILTTVPPYFIHFGCWNNGGCPKDNNLTRVLHNINSLQPRPAFLSICGDNYYPTTIKTKETKIIDGVKIEKEKKKKFLDLDDLKSGFDCLPPDLPIYMTYGNHDFETNLILKPLIDGKEHIETDCQLIKQEISIIEQTSNIHLNLYNERIFNTYTKLLFLDTTIYDDDDATDPNVIKCYSNIILDGHPMVADVNEIREKQLAYIRAFVESIETDTNITNVVIIGHHPLIQFKYKNDMKLINLSQLLNRILYYEIYDKMKSRNITYYYLCADLHQFQPGNIVLHDNMNIKQYIVGTGGATKDPLHKELLLSTITTPLASIDPHISYNMTATDIEQASDDAGYLKCISHNTTIEFVFIKVPLSSSSSGGNNKTRQTKRIQTKRRQTKRRQTKRRQTKRRQTKRRQTKRRQTKLKN